MGKAAKLPINLQDRSSWGAGVENLLSKFEYSLSEYFREEERLFQDPRGSIARSLSPNRFVTAYRSLVEVEAPRTLGGEDIFAFHYTRLCDFERRDIKENGLATASHSGVQRKLNKLVDASILPAVAAENLYRNSVLHDPSQSQFRLGKLCLVSEFLPADHPGVELLLGNWGGEAIYWTAVDEIAQDMLRGIGDPTVVACCVNIGAASIGYQVSKAIVEKAFRGTDAETHFDIFLEYSLPASSVLSVGPPDNIIAMLKKGVSG